MIRQILPLAFTAVTGCSSQIVNLTCSDVSNEAIQISEGNVVSINNREQIRKSDQQILCKGIALTKDGDETPIRFQAFKGDEGEILIKYDDYDYQTVLKTQEKYNEIEEQNQEDQRIKQMVDDAMVESRHAAYAATAPQ